jgi:hypothetical protein
VALETRGPAVELADSPALAVHEDRVAGVDSGLGARCALVASVLPDDTTGTIYVGSEQTGSADMFTTCTSQADDGTFLDHFDDRN